MSIRAKPLLFLLLGLLGVLFLVWTVSAWDPKAIEDDQVVFMPGTQPGHAGNFESPGKCDNCHGGYNSGVEPDYTWRGSMMAQAARDPLWLACLTTATQDSVWALGNTNAGDICIRCHSPTGWLEGRSDPANTQSLVGDDYWGVQCDFCHRLVDPFPELKQPDIPAETDSTAISMAETTYLRDIEVLKQVQLFDGTFFLDTTTNLPTYYGSDFTTSYRHHGSGQFFVDSGNAKRGPYTDAAARHQMEYSRFHKSADLCAACHDVSNPILASVMIGIDTPEKISPQAFYHVERTSSEFSLSAYGNGGATSEIPGVAFVDSCQDCHMRDVTGKGCNKKGAPTRTDLPLHDFTGGNQWMLGILASADQSASAYDPYNYNILSGNKYTGAQIDVLGLQGYGPELTDGAKRAEQQLQMAATLSISSETSSSAVIKVKNNAGHKLISGFPEGRRMFLNVKFFDAGGNQIGEINPYAPLETTKDANGNEVYKSGGILTATDDKLVWETKMSSSLTKETSTFHFALADDRYKDNRIPPKGFDTTKMDDRITQPKYGGLDDPTYFTSAEYSGGYDEVSITKPSGTVSWYATLYYQSTSKEYIEFLRDEINGDASSLSSPTPSGETNAYIVQTDPFFSNLKGWGDAIYDLWLHNGGAAPVVMDTIGAVPAPPCTIDVPLNLEAKGGKRSISLSWDPVNDAEGYKVYYSQGGKYTYIDSTTSESFRITKLQSRQTFYFVVTAYKTCDGTELESDYSNEAWATTR